MNKIKLRLDIGQVKALIFILNLVMNNKPDVMVLSDRASFDSVKKLYMKLIAREDNLKQKNNSITLSIQEAWAFVYRTGIIEKRLEVYEYTVYINIVDQISKITC